MRSTTSVLQVHAALSADNSVMRVTYGCQVIWDYKDGQMLTIWLLYSIEVEYDSSIP
jgi:hypothetical protein